MILSWLKRGGSDRGPPEFPPGDFDPPAPEKPLYVIGDVHGRHDLLLRMLELIDADIYERGIENEAHIVLTGDFVDRGDQSREVVQTVWELHDSMPDRVTPLMGNHEQMMLDFIADPSGRARSWLKYGGLNTLFSFGVGGLGPSPAPERAIEAAGRLADALPPAQLNWLGTLPRQHQSGNVGVVHAAADPASPFDDQSGGDLMWGHPEFFLRPRQDGLWIVHGHTIVPEPKVEDGRISVDTGAYETGRLTCAAIWQGEIRFLST